MIHQYPCTTRGLSTSGVVQVVRAFGALLLSRLIFTYVHLQHAGKISNVFVYHYAPQVYEILICIL